MPEIKVLSVNEGTCHCCNRGKLRKDKMGLVYPYVKVISVRGTNIEMFFCEECFDEVQKFKIK
jgi:hypothetical protein